MRLLYCAAWHLDHCRTGCCGPPLGRPAFGVRPSCRRIYETHPRTVAPVKAPSAGAAPARMVRDGGHIRVHGIRAFMKNLRATLCQRGIVKLGYGGRRGPPFPVPPPWQALARNLPPGPPSVTSSPSHGARRVPRMAAAFTLFQRLHCRQPAANLLNGYAKGLDERA
jgi:hypothetical protein